ncbi:MAG: aldehyde:ferredoxin oxidoreductase [Planctomycetota bacterium]|nr:MAG: aldehyde:ferredoxin oxidoreductase [Planctomycetota bacterium]
MSPRFGYHRRYLRIDLSTQSAESRPLSDSVLRHFVGGVGLGTWLLLEEGLDGVDPLDARMPIAFAFSPLVGTTLTTSAKFAVVAKSPLTHRLSDSLSSSHFAIAGKRTGFDALVIVGAARSPMALRIDGSEADVSVEFLAVDDLWGQSSRIAADAIRQRWGSRFRVAAIGPAGERLVRYATISSDGRHAGRGGLGAVMGAKRLKAIAVAGGQWVSQAHPEELIAYSRDLSRRSFGPATEKYRELGTVSNLLTFNRLGTLPTRNFQEGSFAGAEQLNPEQFVIEHPRTRESCAACTIGCEHLFHGLGKDGQSGVRLEYESLFALGPLCGISNPDIVLQAAALCDDIGIDTISAGATIAFAMECAERGLLEAPDLRFGREEALLGALRSIGERSGLGDRLAEGSRHLSRELGPEAIAIAPHVKGLEIPGYEPRALQSMALGFAVGTRGADHNRSGAYQVDFSNQVDRRALTPEGVRFAIETEDEAAVMDSLILCKFLRGALLDRYAEMAQMLTLITGWSVNADELHQTAQRIVQLRKWYNIRQGWTPSEDTLPARFLSEPLESGSSAGATLSAAHLQQLIIEYNHQRGWDSAGWLSQEQQNRLRQESLNV